MYLATIKGIAYSKPLYKEEFEDKAAAEKKVSEVWKHYTSQSDSFALNHWTKVEYICDDCGGTRQFCS